MNFCCTMAMAEAAAVKRQMTTESASVPCNGIPKTKGRCAMHVLLHLVILALLNAPGNFVSASSQGEDLTRNAKSALSKAQQEISAKKNNDAEKTLLNFIAAYPDENHHFVELTLANIFFEKKQLQKALGHYEKAAELCPSYAPTWQNLGKIYFDLKRFKKAAHAMEEAYRTGGRKKHELLFHAAVAHISAKAPEKAFTHIKFLTSGKTGIPKTNHIKILANLAMELKCPEKALGTIEKLLKSKDPDPVLWRLAATLNLELKRYKKATEKLAVYAMLSPLSPAEEMLLADLYNKLGIPSKAAQMYEKILTKTPRKTLYKKLASSWMEACSPEKALAATENGLKRYPHCHGLWKLKGWLCYERHDFENASKAFGRACDLKKNDNKSLFMLGICARKCGHTAKARQALSAIISCPEYTNKARALIREMEEESGNT